MVRLPELELPPTAHRSRTMSLVRARDTRPELEVRKRLFRAGFRYRLHVGSLPGRPDLVLPRLKTAVFVHGCFWHRHSCPRGQRTPKANRAYWAAKLDRNTARDRQNLEVLAETGWQSFTIWECNVAGATDELIELLRLMSSR